MDARSQALLEFPLIRQRLAEATSFPPSRRLVEALEPSNEPVVVARRLDETDQMRSLLEERPGEYLVRAAGSPARIADLACFLRDQDVMLGALQAGRRSLEAVFLQITAEAELNDPETAEDRR